MRDVAPALLLRTASERFDDSSDDEDWRFENTTENETMESDLESDDETGPTGSGEPEVASVSAAAIVEAPANSAAQVNFEEDDDEYLNSFNIN